MGDLPHEHYLAQSGYQIDPKPEPSDFSGLRMSASGPPRCARHGRVGLLTAVTRMEPATPIGSLLEVLFLAKSL